MDLRTLNLKLPALDVIRSLRALNGHVEKRYWRGACPFHLSRSAHSRSLACNLDLGKFFCHKCGAHGDLIDLWSHCRNVSLSDAARQLSEQFLGAPEQEAGTEGMED